MESVFTIGMGLTLAIGMIGVFSNYQDQVTKSTQEKQIESTHYRLKSSIYDLKGADSARTDIKLPDKVGGVEYSVVLDEDIKIITSQNQYNTSLNNLQGYETSGTVEGGEVTLYKSGNQYTLRSN